MDIGALLQRGREEVRHRLAPERTLVAQLRRAWACSTRDVRQTLQCWRDERAGRTHGPAVFDPSADFDLGEDDEDRDDFDDEYDDDPHLVAALAERDEARKNLQAAQEYSARRMEEVRGLRASSVELAEKLLATAEQAAQLQAQVEELRGQRDQAVAAQVAAVARAAEAAAVGLRRETELRQLQDEALRELRQKLAVALGERDAKDRAVDHQIGVLRKLREQIADQSQRLDALTGDARALCTVLRDEERVEAPVLAPLNQLRRRLGDAP